MSLESRKIIIIEEEQYQDASLYMLRSGDHECVIWIVGGMFHATNWTDDHDEIIGCVFNLREELSLPREMQEPPEHLIPVMISPADRGQA